MNGSPEVLLQVCCLLSPPRWVASYPDTCVMAANGGGCGGRYEDASRYPIRGM